MLDSQQIKARQEILVLRHHFIKGIREFFVNHHDFIEVETPLLVANPGLEPHLEYFETVFTPNMGGGKEQKFFLPTSPEYHLKKALASGLPRVFEISRSFRNGELSRRHQPEFAMLEWYRHPGGYKDISNDTLKLFEFMSERFSKRPSDWRDIKHFTVLEAFEEFCGIALDLILRNGEQKSLARRAREAGFSHIEADASFDDVFNFLVVDVIEKEFQKFNVCFLWDYPLEMAALSRRKKANPHLCERYEVYFHGVELANAFGELTDSVEQRKRCLVDQNKREEMYKVPSPPLDEEFFEALDCLDEAGGIALGVDRFLQCLVGATEISKVLAFPKRQNDAT